MFAPQTPWPTKVLEFWTDIGEPVETIPHDFWSDNYNCHKIVFIIEDKYVIMLN